MPNPFRWPYEVRRAMPDEFGVFAQKDGLNHGPVTEQQIKAGVVTQVVREPVRVLDVGVGLVITSDVDSEVLSLRVDPEFVGGVVGSGEFSLDDGTFLNPTSLFSFNDGAF
jgi:hypothetical protein